MRCATYPTAALTSTAASDLGTETVSRALGEFCVESEHPQRLENQDSMLPVNLIVPGAGHSSPGRDRGTGVHERGGLITEALLYSSDKVQSLISPRVGLFEL